RPGEQVIEEYKKGDRVKAKVLDVDVEKERISLGIKQLAGDPMETAGDLKKGSVVTCEVIEVKEAGIDVKIVGSDLTTFINPSAPRWGRARGATRARSFSGGGKGSRPRPPGATAAPTRCRSRSRRSKWRKRRRRSPNTAPPIRGRRSATSSAPRSSAQRKSPP